MTRLPAPPADFRLLLEADLSPAQYKSDGHFAFAGVGPASAERVFRLESELYQSRTFRKVKDGAEPVELEYPGEDELYLAVTAVNGPRIAFEAVPFLPPLRKGAPVLGASFATDLAFDLAGRNVSSAELASSEGVVAGSLLRIIRSRSLLAKAGPEFPFPPGFTLGRLQCVRSREESGGFSRRPIDGARLRVVRVNGVRPQPAMVGDVSLLVVHLVGERTLILGPARDLETTTNQRGRAILYFPDHWSVSSVDIEVSRPGFMERSLVLPLVRGKTSAVTVELSAASGATS